MSERKGVSRRAFLTTATVAAGMTVAHRAIGGGAAEIVLPPLPYDEGALAPVVSARTVGFHYGKHHRGYVSTLNKLLPGSPCEGKALEAIIRETAGKSDATAVFNNAAQVWNHTFYWRSLAPAGRGGAPSKALESALQAAFGSVDGCRAALLEAATKQFGSGWAWLVAEKGALKVVKTPNAETPLTQAGVAPLLAVDVWEHAYYLDWQNRRADYVKAVCKKLLNWTFASENFAKA